MKILLFGATGMVGKGVLRECLLDHDVEAVLALGRAKTDEENPKLREVVLKDLADLSSLEGELATYDACFFCLGVSAAGMSEADYRRITHDLTLAVATMLVKLNPKMTFVYVSGNGTDSTEKGWQMWARVKGQTENELLALPFERCFMFRPAMIQPMHGIRSRTGFYRVVYGALGPVLPMLRGALPGLVTTTEIVGRAMVRVAKKGASKRVLENRDIGELGR